MKVPSWVLWWAKPLWKSSNTTASWRPRRALAVHLDGGRLVDGEHADGHFVLPFVYTMKHNSNARVLREEVFWTARRAHSLQ